MISDRVKEIGETKKNAPADILVDKAQTVISQREEISKKFSKTGDVILYTSDGVDTNIDDPERIYALNMVNMSKEEALRLARNVVKKHHGFVNKYLLGRSVDMPEKIETCLDKLIEATSSTDPQILIKRLVDTRETLQVRINILSGQDSSSRYEIDSLSKRLDKIRSAVAELQQT